MTDLLFMSIWILISSLIRQIENGSGDSDNESDEEGDGNETQSKGAEGEGEGLGIEQVEFEPYEPITQAIKIAIASIFSPTARSLSLCLQENWP